MVYDAGKGGGVESGGEALRSEKSLQEIRFFQQ
jgi:hypothetical protein